MDEQRRAKLLLATQVATMMGRKLEEGDWTSVYGRAKGIPDTGWSNLHIDVNHGGLGVEHKLLRVSQLRGRPLKSVCGTTLMHPAATRSIRIEDTTHPPERVKDDVFAQYRDLINARTDRVREATPGTQPDMRTGWLIWEDSLTEFLYFEERMLPPVAESYFAVWNTTPARGARKASKSLWIYDNTTRQKRYSVTTSAGVKIQPYFDVPAPSDPNLYYFRVQSEPVDGNTVHLWVSASTARGLERKLGSLDRDVVSEAILDAVSRITTPLPEPNPDDDLATAIPITVAAHQYLVAAWEAVSDEHRAQLLLKALA